MFTDHCPSVRSACYTPHNTYNIVTGLVSRHPKSEWRFGVQMNNCLKFDNDDLEHQNRTMDTMFLNDPLPKDNYQHGNKLNYANDGTEALCYY